MLIKLKYIFLFIELLLFSNLQLYGDNSYWRLSDSIRIEKGTPNYQYIACADSMNCMSILQHQAAELYNRYTTNGGITWQTSLIDTIIRVKTSRGWDSMSYTPPNPYGLVYPDSNLCILIGSKTMFWGYTKAYYWRSTDRCKSWIKYELDTGRSIGCLKMLDSRYGLLTEGVTKIYKDSITKKDSVLIKSYLYYTNDSAKSWSELVVELLDSVNLYPFNYHSVYLLDERKFRLIITQGISEDSGIKYYLIGTDDRGKTWNYYSEFNSGDVQHYYGISDLYFIDEKNVWAAGWKRIKKYTVVSNVILHSTDGGYNWQIVIDTLIGNNHEMGLGKIIFSDELHGTAPSSDGLVFRTSDGGKTWDIEDKRLDGSIGYLWDFAKPSNNIEYYTSSAPYGRIFKWDRNITGIDEFDIKKQDLELFPNPVSNVLNLNFSVYTSYENVRIELFDNLGRKVKSLINKNYIQGTYSEVSDISKLDNGIYYLVINIGKEKTVRKVIVMN